MSWGATGDEHTLESSSLDLPDMDPMSGAMTLQLRASHVAVHSLDLPDMDPVVQTSVSESMSRPPPRLDTPSPLAHLPHPLGHPLGHPCSSEPQGTHCTEPRRTHSNSSNEAAEAQVQGMQGSQSNGPQPMPAPPPPQHSHSAAAPTAELARS